MEEDKQKKRNVRPVEKSKLPTITLVVLTVLVSALLYIGYDYLSDEPGDTSEVTNADSDREVVSLDAYNEPSQIEPGAAGPVPVPGAGAPDVKKVEPKSEPKVENEKKATTDTKVTGGQSHSHTVATGETLSSIATRYNMSVETLKSLNSSIKDNSSLKAGGKVNVRIQAIHTVGPGDILRVVGQKYGVSADLIMRANNKAKNHAARGEKLIIPFAQKK
jgi:LysM repeat protein